ncbi:MAG: RNA pseudouridine synthase, partial [Candidatus Omnitrophica bacterium]|nr:RNA pseudouridine synthase [Candidatus Omnitrophota bacterium]
DKDTSGVLVFAKSEQAKRFLQDEWHRFTKIYYAVVNGVLGEKTGVFTSYIAENSVHKMYSVSDPKKGKLARTGYKVLKESKDFSLIKIDLLTGKKNQIRVHLSEQGHPVVGDKKYGRAEKDIKRLALHAASISIVHPHTKEKLTFKTKVPGYFKSLIDGRMVK